MRALFVSWDGPDQNYHESLFMPILARSRRPGDEVHLLQYGWGAEAREASVQAEASRLGLPYTARSVWRTPQVPATVGMIGRGAVDLVRYSRRHRVSVLMPRSTIPAAMAILALPALPDVRLLYDADGLMADERADFGGWSRQGLPYRTLRAIDDAVVRRADGVLTRTHRSASLLAERAGLDDPSKIVVVSNGKDADHFRPGTARQRAATREALGVAEGAPLLVHVGTLGPQYYPDRLAAFAATVQARRPDAHLLILTGNCDLAFAACRDAGLDPSGYTVRRVRPNDVPPYLAAADVGLAIRMASLSQQAVAPIKVGEYLLCGLPVLSTRGIGDLDAQLDASVGEFVGRLDAADLERAAGWLLNKVLPERDAFRRACRERGVQTFSLAHSARQYQAAFDQVSS